MHGKHKLIAVPIGKGVGGERKGQCDENTGLAADQKADGEKKRCEGSEQKACAKAVHVFVRLNPFIYKPIWP